MRRNRILLVVILAVTILVTLVVLVVLIVIVLILIVLLLILQHLSGIDEILLCIQIIRSENQSLSESLHGSLIILPLKSHITKIIQIISR